MNGPLLLPATVATLTALVGWWVVHQLNLRRELAAEKRKLRVSYIIEAYRKIEGASNRPSLAHGDHMQVMESAIADIQLLGTPEQVSLAQQLALEFAEAGAVSFTPLLISLRRSLRKELELEAVDEQLKFLRVTTHR